MSECVGIPWSNTVAVLGICAMTVMLAWIAITKS